MRRVNVYYLDAVFAGAMRHVYAPYGAGRSMALRARRPVGAMCGKMQIIKVRRLMARCAMSHGFTMG